MRRVSYGNEEVCSGDNESDRYSLDNLDLLNLRVSFSSEARKGSENSLKLNSGDEKQRSLYTNKRSQRSHYTCCGDTTNSYKVQKSQSEVGHPSSKRSADLSDENTINNKTEHKEENSVVLLYSNQKKFSQNSIQDDFLLPRRSKNHIESKRSLVEQGAGDEPRLQLSSSRTRFKEREEQSEDEKKFPFRRTPSGNLKVSSNQVVFQSEKLSVVVADPNSTKVNIRPGTNVINRFSTMQREGDSMKESMMEHFVHNGLGSSLGSLLVGRLAEAPGRKEKEASEYEGKATNEILDPELNLNRLGYTASDPIDWSEVILPEKKNLYLELYARITNFTNADCKVYIDNEEFNCHLIVLQCYSEVFHTYVAVKKVELPADKCSAASFAFIYEWMITGDPSYRDLNRENVLDIFNAAKYLKIRDLIEQCWAFIDNPEVFSEDTAFLLYQDAKEKNLPEVRELMLPRIQKFFLMLVSSQDWLELDLEDVQNFLQSNYICVNCEMEVFMSAVRWLKHDYENKEKYKVAVLNCVRFGNIAPWQLVDIKRNPDNPDFKELARDPEICKMIDDGLAFVIIKYWYGQENDDYQHWNSILALKEPPARNWSGMDKTYFTYREFLIYLDQYRRNQMIEKSKPKEKRKKLANLESGPSPSISTERVPGGKIPTMDEFLSTRKNTPRKISPRRPTDLKEKYVVQRLRRKPKNKKPLTRHEAAIIIQRAYREHLKKQYRLNRISPKKIKKPYPKMTEGIHSSPKETKRPNFPWKTDQRVLSMFAKTEPPTNKDMAKMMTPKLRELTTDPSLFNYDRESILVFGGTDPHMTYGIGRNTGKDIYKYLPHANQWEFVGEMPEPRYQHSSVFMRGRVFIVGGADPRHDEKRGKSLVCGTVWSFCPVTRRWYKETSMSQKRKNFGLVPTEKYMYAIGGQDRTGRTLISVEKYNVQTGVWKDCAPLLYARMGLACCKYEGKIWVSGGMSGSRKNPLCPAVETYDIEHNQWTEIAYLNFPRCFACMFAMGNKLYLIGGAGKKIDDDKSTKSLCSVDVWDGNTLDWVQVGEMTIPRHGHAVAYLGTQIFIIGGVTTMYMRALSNIECYCANRGCWVRGIQPLPVLLAGHTAVTLPPARLV